MSLALVSNLVPLGHHWIVVNLQTIVRCLGNLLVLSLTFLLSFVLADPGTSGFSCLCGTRLPDSGTSGLRPRNLQS
jgi:hypothetical protein